MVTRSSLSVLSASFMVRKNNDTNHSEAGYEGEFIVFRNSPRK